MEKNQLRYSIDGSGIASNLTALLDRKRLENKGEFEQADELLRKEKVSESSIINNFVRRCSSDEVIKAECQVDKDSEGKLSEGITTYSVQTKTSQLITIGIHENNYALCKDQMAVLGNAVQKAKEKINNNRKETVRKVVGGITITMAVGLTIWAGSIKLHDWLGGKDKDNKPGVEATTEATTEELTEATPIDATEESLEDKYDAEYLKNSMDEANQKAWDDQMENLNQIRQELGLSTEAVVQTTEAPTEALTEAPTEDVLNVNLGEKYDADYFRKSMEDTNQRVIDEQKQYLEDLRQSYEDEYKVKSY